MGVVRELVAAAESLRTAVILGDARALSAATHRYGELLAELEQLEQAAGDTGAGLTASADPAARTDLVAELAELMALQAELQVLLRQALQRATFRLGLLQGLGAGSGFVDRRA